MLLVKPSSEFVNVTFAADTDAPVLSVTTP
jgi:hypothetical protein